jgi:acyl-CoA reductase-like NAD-dependent aldehyde dehydrogenase
VQVPTRGVALFINAFNFPSWGLWEKAAPALLSGVPVIVKPATATAWLTQRMVKDVVDAGVLPAGALSVICGSSAGLLDQLQPFDVLSFTGSAETAAVIRSHPAVTQRSVRVNIEADSVNSALLLPGAAPGSEAFDLLVKEVVREMTVKAGQKCTAIRRVHDTEVFGPVATLLPYRDEAHAMQLIRRGQGSLVASLYGSDPGALAGAALGLADSHGRVHVISPDVAALHTGHGNVMPQSLHGGPGRAGGGEELGGARALNFYHRRAAIQASTAVLGAMN